MRKLLDIFVSIIASIMYQVECWTEHYNGPKYKSVIQDYDNFLRDQIKHTDNQGSYDDARDELYAQAKAWGVSIWD